MASTFVVPFKMDLDVLGALFLLGANPDEDEFHTANTRTPEGRAQLETWLADPEVWCIEVGGSGQFHLRNVDHHGEGAPEECATLQVWQHMATCVSGPTEILEAFARYVNIVDTGGIGALPEPRSETTLTDVVAGLLLTALDERWHPTQVIEEASAFFKLTTFTDPQNPFGDFTGFAPEFVERKREEDSAAENAALNIVILPLSYPGVLTHQLWRLARLGQERACRDQIEAVIGDVVGGRKLAILVSNYRMATGSCYRAGGDYALCVAPNFNRTGQRKITVGVNTRTNPDGDVTPFLKALNEIEPGAGGPSHGVIPQHLAPGKMR